MGDQVERKLFEPVDGVSPRWRKLADLVSAKNVGDEVTYREAGEALGFMQLTDRTLRIVQAAMRDTQKNLEARGERTVGTVARFGWIVLDASKELQQVNRRLAKTRRAAGRVIRGASALNSRREELSQFERERLDRVVFSAQMAAEVSGRRSSNISDLKRMIESRSEKAV
jgi:hypothetical protein